MTEQVRITSYEGGFRNPTIQSIQQGGIKAQAVPGKPALSMGFYVSTLTVIGVDQDSLKRIEDKRTSGRRYTLKLERAEQAARELVAMRNITVGTIILDGAYVVTAISTIFKEVTVRPWRGYVDYSSPASTVSLLDAMPPDPKGGPRRRKPR